MRKQKYYYLVLNIITEGDSKVGKIKMSQDEIGIVGVLPLFSSRAKAEKYANGRPIVKFEAEW